MSNQCLTPCESENYESYIPRMSRRHSSMVPFTNDGDETLDCKCVPTWVFRWNLTKGHHWHSKSVSNSMWKWKLRKLQSLGSRHPRRPLVPVSREGRVRNVRCEVEISHKKHHGTFWRELYSKLESRVKLKIGLKLTEKTLLVWKNDWDVNPHCLRPGRGGNVKCEVSVSTQKTPWNFWRELYSELESRVKMKIGLKLTEKTPLGCEKRGDNGRRPIHTRGGRGET